MFMYSVITILVCGYGSHFHRPKHKYLTLPAALSPVLCEKHTLQFFDRKVPIKIFEHKKDTTGNVRGVAEK